MYGFIEKRLADIIGCQYDNFVLNDGCAAALVSRETFINIKDALLSISSRNHDNELLRPYEVPSDVSGMKVMIHRYWFNENVLHGLTNAEIKRLPQYEAFMNLGTARFNGPQFEADIRAYYSDTPSEAVDDVDGDGNTAELAQEDEAVYTGDDINQESNVEPEQEPIDEIDEEEQTFLHFIDSSPRFSAYAENGHSFSTFSEKGKRVKVVGSFNGRFHLMGNFTELADKLNKNIIIIYGETKRRFSEIKKILSFSSIEKHSIIISINPGGNQEFVYTPVSTKLFNNCYGQKIYDLHSVRALDLQTDLSLSKEELEVVQERMKSRPSISNYAKFDCIYKDTVTNVVWGVRDRCAVYILFNYEDRNLKAYELCTKELGRRFNGNISLTELKSIDKSYHNEIHDLNRKSYLDFAVSSSKSILNKIKEMQATCEAEYKNYLAKALESGKMANKYMDQISSFDESSLVKTETEKALQAFNFTMEIPQVLSIDIADECVHVYTKNLYARDERTKKYHDIGTFHISIGMLGNSYNVDKTVVIMNTKHQINGLQQNMQAPHVYPDGKICHGSLSAPMTSAYKNRDLFSLVQQLVIFLQDANTDDVAGKYISKWPEVSEDIALGRIYTSDDEVRELSESEKKFDAMLANSIPVHI